MSLPMFVRQSFYVDWTNHIWAIQHFRDLILTGQQVPDFINVKDAKFEPLSLFYGTFFYPFFAILSIPFGADITVKLAALGLVAIIFRETFKLLTFLGRSQRYSIFGSILFVAHVYALTNLYNRSALTEFFALQFLTASLVILLSTLVFYTHQKNSLFRISVGFVFLVVALGTHPIVAFTSAIFVLPTFTFFLLTRWKKLAKNAKRVFLVWSTLSLAILAPLYALIIKYRTEFPIGNDLYLTVFPQSIDSLMARLGIVYIDSRVLGANLEEVSTPFLNAPLGLPLIGYLVFVIARNIRSQGLKNHFSTYIVTIFSVSALVACLLIIPFQTPETPGLWLEISRALAPIQFLYRLSGTLHVLIIVVIVIVEIQHSETRGERQETFQRPTRSLAVTALAALFAFSLHIGLTAFEFSGVAAKSANTSNVRESILSDDSFYSEAIRNTGYFPDTFYGMRAYNMEKDLVTLDPVNTNVLYVEVDPYQPTTFSCGQDSCLVRTDVYPTKLIRIKVNGEIRDQQELVDRNIGFFSSQGSHTVEVVVVENLVLWIKITFGVLISLIFVVGAQGVRIFVATRTRASQPSR